jgi:hypothetical protein
MLMVVLRRSGKIPLAARAATVALAAAIRQRGEVAGMEATTIIDTYLAQRDFDRSRAPDTM